MIFRFGSFNLMNLGRTAIGKREFSKIAEIIEREHMDLVAFQEILSQGSSLEHMVHNYLPKWEMRWAEPCESSDPSKTKDRRGEGFAFIWNTKKLRLASSSTDHGERIYEPRIVSEALRFDSRMLARTPFYARFVPVNGGFFEFRLLNVHLHFGANTVDEIQKRKEEYDFLLERIYPSISTERRYGNNREAYTLVMGDYNLNLYKPRGEAESRINKNTYITPQRIVNRQRIVTVQDELTTLKSVKTDEVSVDDNPERGYSQNYDHFSFDANIFELENIQCKYRRIDAVRKYCNDDFQMYRSEISDHLPILLELRMNERL